MSLLMARTQEVQVLVRCALLSAQRLWVSLMTSAMGVFSVHSGRDYGASTSDITFLGNTWQDAHYSASSPCVYRGYRCIR